VRQFGSISLDILFDPALMLPASLGSSMNSSSLRTLPGTASRR
jgi:hypothetical protein